MRKNVMIGAAAGVALVAGGAFAAGPFGPGPFGAGPGGPGSGWRLAQAEAQDQGEQQPAPGQGMMGQGMGRGPGMMGQGQGMMGQGMMGRGPGAGRGEPGAGMQKMCEDIDAKVAAMLAYAETALDLTEDQQDEWQAVEKAAREAADTMERTCDEAKGQPMPATLPERLQRMQQMASTRLSALQTITPPVESLYGTLSAEQKQTLDSMRMMMGHHGRWRR